MVRSANEGANLIAETLYGSVPAFAEVMNEAAAMYGCTGTHFANANGLHDPNHYTTGARYGQDRPGRHAERDLPRHRQNLYLSPAGQQSAQRARAHLQFPCIFNPSLEENDAYYPYAIGIKTGFTNAAGHCFVGAAERDGVELISVVFYTTAGPAAGPIRSS